MPRMTTPPRRALLAFALATLLAPRVSAQSFDPQTVPPELRAWMPWIAANELDYGCTRIGGELVCAFPGSLELVVGPNEVRFSLFVTLDRERTVQLPGAVGEWPVDVREGARELVVVDGDGPTTRLPAGAHRIDGRIRYGRAPASIHVPADVARIVAVAGATRTPLARASEGVVPLRDVAAAQSPGVEASESDTVSIEVVRRIRDDVPLVVDTQVTVRIGGRARPIELGHALLAGSIPVAVESTLPIQVSPDGNVSLQAQSGTHRIRVCAMFADPNAPLVAPELPEPWARQEIWLFAPNEEYRQVDVRGVSSIDPQSPSIPDDWRSAAAYVLRGGERMTLAEARRGEPEQPPNAITIARRMWLDLDGSGFSIEDRLSGELHRADRIDLLAGDLGRISMAGTGQLITLPSGGPRNARGIEVRSAAVDLVAEWRFEGSPSSVPAVGWSEDARTLSVELNLPPGYTLFDARGVDESYSFVEQWDVGPIFLVLLLAVIAARLLGKAAGAVMGLTLVLTFFESDAPTFLWLAVLVPLAMLSLFKKGTFARLVFLGFAACTFVLVISVGYLVTKQVRYAMHPQLYTEEGGSLSTNALGNPAEPEMAQAPMDEQGGMGVSNRSSPLGRSADSGNVYGADDSRTVANWIDPNAVVQTGHGLVSWTHSQRQLRWTGPVTKDHRIRLTLITPAMQRVLAFLRAAGSLFLLLCLARKRPSFPEASPPRTGTPIAPAPGRPPVQTPPQESPKDLSNETAPVASPAATALLALLVALGASSVASAQPQGNVVVPSTDPPPNPLMLEALRERMLRPPACGDACGRFGDGVLVVDGDQLRIELVAHADARVAVLLPGPISNFVPDTVTVDGAPSNAMRATADGHIALRLEPGVHRVVLASSLASRGSVALSFPSVPGRLELRVNGWTVSGVDENGQVRAGVELRRNLAAVPAANESPGAAARSADVPLWVSVDRHVDIGVQWLVQTTISRRSTTSSPGVVRIAALPGETVLGNEATIANGTIVVTIPQGVSSVTFSSSVRVSPSLRFTSPNAPVAAADLHASPTWSYSCSPLWHCTSEGLSPLHRIVETRVAPTFAPYPGESLTITPVRLGAAPGRSFTIDGVKLRMTPGSRSRTSQLDLEVRTSVSNTLRLRLPRGLEVERVDVEGERRAVQVRGDALAIGIAPSQTRVSITFLESRPLSFEVATPKIRIDSDLVDIELTVEVPSDRWVLFTSGPNWGPIVLFWGHLVFVLVVAFALGRVPRSPLKAYEWALLALGLTQIPLPFTAIVALWFFAVKVQHERKLEGIWFNLAQLALFGFALVSAVILISAVWIGLTSRPDMQIVGNSSSANWLNWYADRGRSVLPTASFFSVSIWVWKGLMLAWAFWLASSVVRWSIWAFSPFRESGFFDRSRPKG